MKYLKKFENHTQYEEARQNLILPNVSLCTQENKVHYNPIETRLVGTFNVTNTSQPTRILWGASGFTEIEIDGVKQSSVAIDYQFSTVGEHIVKYTLTDPTIIGKQAFAGANALVGVIIPNGVTSIDFQAFVSTSLTSVTIPNSVRSIGTYAFVGCSGLTEVTIPDSVASIGDNAFESCSGLTSITIPDSVTSIGFAAFRNCGNISTITSHIMNAPSVNGGTFQGVKNGGTLYVPIGSSGYETWMNDQGNLGYHNWVKVEQ